MKKILALGIALLALAACEMDFVPSDAMTSAALKSNPESAVYTTDGIYALFKDCLPYKGEDGGANDNRFVRHFFQITETRGDNVTISGHSTDPFLGPYRYEDQPTKNNIYYTWWISYKIIYAANANIDGMDPDATGKIAHLLGENYFIRAFAHYNLVNMFALPYSAGRDNPGIPLRIGMDYSKTTRASVGAVYDAIEKDLKKAYEYMDKGSPRGPEYASATAARLLLSRVCLAMGDETHLQECITLCNTLIGQAPAAVKSEFTQTALSNYPAATYDSPETIWCIRHFFPADLTDPWGNVERNVTVGAMYYASGAEKDGWGEWYWNDELIELFQRYPEDRRFKAYFHYNPQAVLDNGLKMVTFPIKDAKGDFCYSGIAKELTPNPDGSFSFTFDKKNYTATPETVGGYTRYYLNGNLTGDASFGKDGKSPAYIRDDVNGDVGIRSNMYVKYFNTKFSGQDGYMTATSPVFLRWGEAWLNRAEAYARTNKVDEALADVNVIRHRAGLPATADFDATNMAARGYTDVLDVVLDERRMEFCFEGQRMFDLLRNKKSIDRRYVGYHPWEVIDYNDPRLALRIPLDEVNAPGTDVTQNKR